MSTFITPPHSTPWASGRHTLGHLPAPMRIACLLLQQIVWPHPSVINHTSGVTVVSRLTEYICGILGFRIFANRTCEVMANVSVQLPRRLVWRKRRKLLARAEKWLIVTVHSCALEMCLLAYLLTALPLCGTHGWQLSLARQVLSPVVAPVKR